MFKAGQRLGVVSEPGKARPDDIGIQRHEDAAADGLPQLQGLPGRGGGFLGLSGEGEQQRTAVLGDSGGESLNAPEAFGCVRFFRPDQNPSGFRGAVESGLTGELDVLKTDLLQQGQEILSR